MKRTSSNDASSNGPPPGDSRGAGEDSLMYVPVDFDVDDTFPPEGEPPGPPAGGASAGAGHDAGPDESQVRSGRAATPSTNGDQQAPIRSFSIAQLLDTGVPLDWREAVSIARRMCEAIARHPAAGTHEYHLDPRHIEITEEGDVVVEPGQPGTDPFVKQIGRILRALLEGGDAPPQLRLLISQALFDVPGFVSLKKFSEALSSFEKQAKDDAVRVAFRRVREKNYSVAPIRSAPTPAGTLPAARAGRSAAAADLTVEPPRHMSPRRYVAGRAAAIVIGVGAALGFWLNRDSYEVQPLPPQAAVAPTRSVSASQPAPPAPRLEAIPALPPRTPAVAAAPGPRPARPQRAAAGATGGITPPQPLEPAPVALSSKPVLPPTSAPEEPRRRQPGPIVADAVPDDSLRSLALAFDHYNRGRAALDRDDYEQALSDAGRAEAVLDELDTGVAPRELYDRIRQLVAGADAVRAREEARIYTSADTEVTPPVAIGRQLPSAAPASLARTNIGTLEMVINRDGQVEVLKLRTPLNRFHERMIVSAAKAWRYRPALKNGRPVRFLLVSSINLPES